MEEGRGSIPRGVRHYSESERRRIVERFRKRGLSKAEFSRREGVQPWSLSSWCRRLGTERISDLFIEIGGDEERGGFKLEFQGVTVTVPINFEPESLRLLLKTIKGAGC